MLVRFVGLLIFLCVSLVMPYSTAKSSVKRLDANAEVTEIFNTIMEKELKLEGHQIFSPLVSLCSKEASFPCYISFQAQLESQDFLKPPSFIVLSYTAVIKI